MSDTRDNGRPGTVPLPLSQVLRRARRPDLSAQERADVWRIAAECAVKYLTAVVLSLLEIVDPESARSRTRQLVESPTLGVWTNVLRGAESDLRRHYLDPIALTFINSINSKRRRADEKFADAENAAKRLLRSLDSDEFPFNPSWAGIAEVIVLFRNKTAHGAELSEWYGEVADDLSLVAERLIEALADLDPVLAIRRSEAGRYLLLDSALDTYVHINENAPDVVAIGLSQDPDSPSQLVNVVGWSSAAMFIDADRERVYFVNSPVRRDGRCEYLDYFTGDKLLREVPLDVLDAAPPPPSVTAGRPELDWNDPIPNNLPRHSDAWIDRPELEAALDQYLAMLQNPVITLHGVGGVGKTALALRAARKAVESGGDRFDVVLWFSARDVDLLTTGQRVTERDVTDIFGIASTFSDLIEGGVSDSDPVEVLGRELSQRGLSYLIILDNFETLDDPARVQRFITDHILPPNKVVITSRLRAFEGDMPIPVGGLEEREADALMIAEARARRAEGNLNAKLRTRIYGATSGIAYALKLAVALIANGEHPNSVLQKVQSDSNLLDTLFRRSFDGIGREAQYLALLVGRVSGEVPELLLRVVFARRGMEFSEAEDAVTRQAIIRRGMLSTGEYAYSAPTVAVAFLRAELVVSERSVDIETDAGLISEMRHRAANNEEERANEIARDIVAQLGRASNAATQRDELVDILEELARVHPGVWAYVADLRRRAGLAHDQVIAAITQGLKVDPESVELWAYWIESEWSEGDRSRALSLSAQAAEACGDSPRDVSTIAGKLLEIVSAPEFHSTDIDKSPHIASVASSLSRHRSRLNAEDLSRLAWLEIHRGNDRAALDAIQQGLRTEPRDQHLLRLLRTLRSHHPDMFTTSADLQ